MVEEVSDMLVKELPALTDSVQSEIGRPSNLSVKACKAEKQAQKERGLVKTV